MAGHPDHGGPSKRSALDQLPLKQRVLAEQRGFLVPEPDPQDEPDDWAPASDERRLRRLGVIGVVVVAIGLVVGVIALGAALR